MMRFYARNFAKMVSGLERSESLLLLSLSGRADLAAETPKLLDNEMSFVFKHLDTLPVSPVVKGQADRLKANIAACDMTQVTERHVILRLVQELKLNVAADLGENLFLLVPAADKPLFLMPEATYWGPSLVSSYVDAHEDLKSCAQCLALGMWTASVFHAMRAVQYGLRRLSDRFEVEFSADFDALNWGQIIKELDKKLKALEQGPKTRERDVELQFGAKASSHFFAIKEAWRNYVMHGRSTYDETEARAIIASVRAILLALA